MVYLFFAVILSDMSSCTTGYAFPASEDLNLKISHGSTTPDSLWYCKLRLETPSLNPAPLPAIVLSLGVVGHTSKLNESMYLKAAWKVIRKIILISAYEFILQKHSITN